MRQIFCLVAHLNRFEEALHLIALPLHLCLYFSFKLTRVAALLVNSCKLYRTGTMVYSAYLNFALVTHLAAKVQCQVL